MSDMRLIVAGAGGRMGRTLIDAIASMDGAVLAGAVEAAGSAVIGRDAGELAGLGKNGVSVATDVEPLLGETDGRVGFTRAVGAGAPRRPRGCPTSRWRARPSLPPSSRRATGWCTSSAPPG